MLHSQSNRSLQSGATDASDSMQVSMSREEALSLLQSESLKALHENDDGNTRSGNSTAANKVQSDDTLVTDSSDQSPAKSKYSSKSTSDDDSNDSILNWLDEPRVPTQNKRQPLLPPQSKPTPLDGPHKSDPIKEDRVHKEDGVELSQWKEWLTVSPGEAENPSVMELVERAASSKLPSEWERVNDNLYHNIRTNERRMEHPLLEQMRNDLETIRGHGRGQESGVKSSDTKAGTLKSSQSTSLSSLTVNTHITSTPLRQIDSAVQAHSSSAMESVVVRDTAATTSQRPVQSAKAQMSKTTPQENMMKHVESDELHHKREAESLIIKNLRMELTETRITLSRLMKDKTRLMDEVEEANSKTEILLSEQRQRLSQSHNMEVKQLQTEIADLRALNSKLMTQHQAELLNLESSIRAGESKQKQRAIHELTLSEQRGREELGHQMELHRQTVDELKLQHQNEIEMLHSMHQKQLRALRTHNKSEGQLDMLITKMESSTQSLNRIQKNLVLDREHTKNERESKIEEKERILTEKDEELLLERKAHRELLGRFQSLVEETKVEKLRIRNAEDALKRREEQLSHDLSDGNRELNLQRDVLNEDRRKFQLHQSRWEKLKQDEMEDIHRLKTDHTNAVQAFYEEQELERARLAKQRQIMAEDKTRFLHSRQRLEAEREAFDDKLLSLEEKRHALEMEQGVFERKVQDVSAMSRRVHQQSEIVTKMYNDSKALEEENNAVQMELMTQSKELKMMKQQLLMEKHHIEKERALLEQDQLSLLTTKRDMMNHMDSMRAMQQRQQSTVVLAKENVVDPANKHPTLCANPRQWQNQPNMTKIRSELRDLREFVEKCNHSISAHRDDVRDLRRKRESYRDSPKTVDCSQISRINALKMSFPSFVSKSGSFATTQSMQMSRSRSGRSLTSTLSSRHRNMERERKREDESTGNWRITLDKTGRSTQSGIDNLSKIDVSDNTVQHDVTRTPVLGRKSTNHLGAFNVTDNTLSGTFVSMANIDTPITIDNKNKTRKRIDRILEDSTLPMTPTKMPNLSEINVSAMDNEDGASVGDESNSFDHDEAKDEVEDNIA